MSRTHSSVSQLVTNCMGVLVWAAIDECIDEHTRSKVWSDLGAVIRARTAFTGVVRREIDSL